MKEYTITYTADVTEIHKIDEPLPEHYTDEKEVAAWIKEQLEIVDDVHVRNVKVFEREVSDDDE